MSLVRLPAHALFASLLCLSLLACSGDGGGGSGASDTASEADTVPEAGTPDGEPSGAEPDGQSTEPDPGAMTDTGEPEAGEPDVPAEPEPLPEVDPRFEGLDYQEVAWLEGLSANASVVRDEMGVPHIYAATLEDAARAHGYMHAMDRMPVMELFRRVAMGTLAELLGALSPGTIHDDILTRHYGFPYIAQLQYESLEEGSRTKRVLDAYSEGVTAYIQELRDGKRDYHPAYKILVPIEPLEDWSPVHSLAIGRVQAHELSFDGHREADHTGVMQAIAGAFPPDSEDPALAARFHMLGDVWRWQPADPAIQHDVFEFEGEVFSKVVADLSGALAQRPKVSEALMERAKAAAEGRTWLKADPLAKGASNNWSAGPTKTKSGNAIFCNDPHLGLGNPPLFHLSHFVAEEEEGGPIEVSGANFGGVPGILIGHNRHVAWGLTTASDDRSDVYLETFVAAGESQQATTVVDGEPQPVTTRTEVVKVGQFADVVEEISFEVMTTAGGRVLVPDVSGEGVITPLESGEQLSWAWTGFEVSGEIHSLMDAMTAKTAEEVVEAFQVFDVPNQNIVGGDDQGHIYASTAGNIPIREPGAFTWHPVDNPGGTAPWWILPGDGPADWDGALPASAGPRTIDPDKGWIVTANNDHVGQVLDNDPFNDPFYIGYDYSIGFRAGRIHRLIEGTGPGSPAAGGGLLGLEEMRQIQADTHSALSEALLPLVIEHLAALVEEQAAPGTHAELAELATTYAGIAAELAEGLVMLEAWDGSTGPGISEVGYEHTPSEAEKTGAAATTLFNVFVERVLELLYSDEYAAMGRGVKDSFAMRGLLLFLGDDQDAIATLDDATGESWLWDDLGTPDVVESPAWIIASAWAEAIGTTATLFPEGTPLSERYWGHLHRIIFDSLIPVPGGALNIPADIEPLGGLGFGRPGDQWAVNVCNGGLQNTFYGCGSGPIIRYCIDLAPDAPEATMMLPGGQVTDPQSPHYDDWLPLWLSQKSTPMAFEKADVKARAEHHLVLVPPEE